MPGMSLSLLPPPAGPVSCAARSNTPDQDSAWAAARLCHGYQLAAAKGHPLDTMAVFSRLPALKGSAGKVTSAQGHHYSLACTLRHASSGPDFTSPPVTGPLCFDSGRMSTGSYCSTSCCCAHDPSSVTTSTTSAIPWISPVSVTRKRTLGVAFHQGYSQGYQCDSLANKAACRRQAPGHDHGPAFSCRPQAQRWEHSHAVQIMYGQGFHAAPAHHYAPPAVPRPPAAARPVPAGSPLLPLLRVPGNSVHDVLAYASKWLSFKEPGTLQLAAHCCKRLHQHPDLALVLGQTRLCYSVVMLWLAAKLEERRGGLAGAQHVAQLIGTTTKAVSSMEMQILQLLDWSPYRGFAPQEEVLIFL